MGLKAKEQVKTLIAQRATTIKTVAEKLGCKPNSLTHKLSRGSITYNDVLQIAEMLDYKIIFVDTLE